jgi:hypothetical protein
MLIVILGRIWQKIKSLLRGSVSHRVKNEFVACRVVGFIGFEESERSAQDERLKEGFSVQSSGFRV